MKEILFGMAVGGVLGILLYKNNVVAKEIFDTNEKIIMKNVDKIGQTLNPNSKKDANKKQ